MTATYNVDKKNCVEFHAFENESDGENEKSVVNVYNHDNENGNSKRSTQEDVQINVLPPLSGYSAGIDSAAERDDASKVHHE